MDKEKYISFLGYYVVLKYYGGWGAALDIRESR